MSKREMLKGGAVAGLAVAAPATAQSGRDATAPMRDPVTKFTSQPFPEQKQKWPGLQRDMTPVPDCGETSYVGTGRLKGRKALVV